MSSDKTVQLKLAIIKRVESRYGDRVGTESNPGSCRHVMYSYINAFFDLMASDARVNAAMHDPKSDLMRSFLQNLSYCILHEIVIDNIICSLIVRGSKVEVHEDLKKAVRIVSKERGLTIVTNPISFKQFDYLEKNNLPMPKDSSLLPVSAGVLPTSIHDCAGINVVALSGKDVAFSSYYPRDFLLSCARKDVGKDGRHVMSYNVLRSGKKYIDAPASWSGGTDSIEMLRKTAVRNFVKYF